MTPASGRLNPELALGALLHHLTELEAVLQEDTANAALDHAYQNKQ